MVHLQNNSIMYALHSNSDITNFIFQDFLRSRTLKILRKITFTTGFIGNLRHSYVENR